MRTHSKGPWKTNDIGRPRIVNDADGNPICMTFAPVILNLAVKDGIDRANADLIASAPDMLKMLKRLATISTMDSEWDEQLAALIEKAEGKTK